MANRESHAEATIERLTSALVDHQDRVRILAWSEIRKVVAEAYSLGISQERERCAKWIPVEEKLPRPQQFVLAYYAIDDMEVTWHTGEIWSTEETGEPTHWMNLPEPPAAIRNPDSTEAQ